MNLLSVNSPRRRLLLVLLCLLLASLWSPAHAADAASLPDTSAPIDARTVQRWGAGWRYPQAGWTVVHIEGEPRERGLQHGHLMAAEIAAYIRALSEYWGPKTPDAAWTQNRNVARRLFYSGFSPEQMQEMQGIADGASAEGARVAGRRLDVLDIITLNASNELDSINDALAVTPNAPAIKVATQTLVPVPQRVARVQRKRPQRCNAFVANGAATPDGQIVFGHITMYDLYPANFYNVWMEVKPSTGYRFVMQTTPGGMHSSMDYSINEAGMLLAETTLDQGPMVPGGTSLAARIRQAQQYAGSIDEATEMLTRSNNGLCSTEWLMGDLKRNEIALLTLGAGTSRLHRSSKNEWFEGAEGFYWSDNNIKEQAVRLQASAHRDGRPSAAATYVPSKRDEVWLKKYHAHKGRIDLAFAREALATPEIVSAFGVDAKYTDARLAAKLQSWGSFGPPVGALWLPSAKEARQHPGIRPLIHNPWTLLDVRPPPAETSPATPRDRPDPRKLLGAAAPERAPVLPIPAWQGTLLPASDADIWLPIAFAKLERILAEATLPAAPGAEVTDERDSFGVEMAYYRSLYGYGVRAGADTPLAQTRARMGDTAWHRVVTGKGLLFLASLRAIVGDKVFDAAMRDFGRQRHGQRVSTQDLQAFLQQRTAYPLAPLFDWWMQQSGLPQLALTAAEARPAGAGWQTTVTLDTTRLGPALAVPVSVETAAGTVTQSAVFDSANAQIRITTRQRPLRVVVDKYGATARANVSPFTVLTMDDELEKALIVYGTQDEEVGNHEAARLLQTTLRRREHNVQPPIKSDREVSDDDLRSHHLLLIGRPATNAVAQRFAAQVAVDFGRQSFQVRDQLYTHPESAVLAAGDNPLNPRFSIVMVAGLSSLGSYQMAGRFADEALSYAPVVILPFGRAQQDLVPPLPELTAVPQFR